MRHTAETKRKISASLTGRSLSIETRLKMSERNKRLGIRPKPIFGKKHSEETKRKIGLANSIALKGKKHSIEQRKKNSEAHKGINTWMKGKHNGVEFQKGSIPWNKDKEWLEMRGENSPKYIKDRTQLKRFNDTAKDRRSSAYADWRYRVKVRDKWKCRISNYQCSGRLEVHHILGYTDYPELRYEINNGITLCHAHHPKVRSEEKRLSPYFQDLVSVSNEQL